MIRDRVEPRDDREPNPVLDEHRPGIPRRIADWIKGKGLATLAVIFCLGMGGLLLHLNQLSTRIIESTAMRHASAYSEALAEVRRLYTSEVVARVQSHGIEVTHDYTDREGAIPLPATFSILLAEEISRRGSHTRTRLYSDYPFPWRRDAGPKDDFERAALNQLRAHPEQPFLRFEDHKGTRSLRYATADLMYESCVACHNTHPDSPKTDWEEGDVRGVLEVILPLEDVVAQTRGELSGAILLTAAMALVGIVWVTLVVARLRRDSRSLERRVAERTDALKASQDQLRESQKLEAVGRLAGGIAHEFNNIIMGITGIAHLLRDDIEDGKASAADVRSIIKASDRAAGLVSQLLAFSRRKTPQKLPIDINTSIESIRRMLSAAIGASVDLTLDLGKDLSAVEADAMQVEQLILNLCLNAGDATGQNGRIEIATAHAEIETALTTTFASVPPGRYVRLSIHDDGCGIDKVDQLKVFEPFFTTKPPGSGTGLGLSVVYGIAQEHGCYLDLDSKVGEGTTISIYFPATAKRIEEAVEAKGSQPIPGGSETILVVEDNEGARAAGRSMRSSSPTSKKNSGRILIIEDDDLVLRFLTRHLERTGYAVRGVRCAKDAIAAVKKESFDLILLDNGLPDIMGIAAFTLIQEETSAPMIMLTGNPDEKTRKAARLIGAKSFLSKPIDPAVLVQQIEKHIAH